MSDAAEHPDMLAAEYVLGVLDASARAEAQARLAADPAFAEEVTYWEARLGPLAEDTAPVEPSPEMWARVEAATATVAPSSYTPRAANDDERRVRFWRAWAVGASGLAAASLALAVFVGTRPAPAPVQAQPATPMVATLAADGGVTAVMIAYDPKSGALWVAPAGPMGPGSAVPHLWLMEPDGGVRLVGAIDASKPAKHNLPKALAQEAARAKGLAVSMEPAGTTPTTGPNGPVVAAGDFSAL